MEGRKDLTVQVQEKRTGSLNFGAGFSTVDSIVGFAELSQGNFDLLNWPNFTGGGQKFRLRAQFGSQRKDFVIALTEPYFLDRRLSLGGEMYFREANFLSDVYDQRNYGFSIVARRAFGRFTSGSLEYRLENIEIFDVADGASLAPPVGRRFRDQEPDHDQLGLMIPATIHSSAARDNASSLPRSCRGRFPRRRYPELWLGFRGLAVFSFSL